MKTSKELIAARAAFAKENSKRQRRLALLRKRRSTLTLLEEQEFNMLYAEEEACLNRHILEWNPQIRDWDFKRVPYNLMYALVNYAKKLVLAPDGQLYTGLPAFGAGYFCYASAKDAKSYSEHWNSPKFKVLAVRVNAKGVPSPA